MHKLISRLRKKGTDANGDSLGSGHRPLVIIIAIAALVAVVVLHFAGVIGPNA